MKKTIIIASALFVIAIQAFAQKEFKLAKSSGKLIINNLSNLTVEGYDGKEIIISAIGKPQEVDPRAAGLTSLGSKGFDNTGLGINVTDKNEVTEISIVDRLTSLKVNIKLPSSISLSIKTTSWHLADSTNIVLSNLKGEVDASLKYENIKLSNLTGPLSIKTFGNIEGILTPSFKGPISLASVNGFIDITVPPTAKADLTINTLYEKLYASKDLKLELTEVKAKETATTYITSGGSTNENTSTKNVDNPIIINGFEKNKTSVQNLSSLGSLSMVYEANPIFNSSSSRGTSINGTLNGGGEKIVLKSTYGKIYLRK